MKNSKPMALLLPILLYLPLLIICSLCFGTLYISPENFFDYGSPLNVIIELRFHRFLTACAVGGGLAVSGVSYQAVLRNPLAEPYILGISGGAGLGAAIAVALNCLSISYASLPIFSFFGSLTVLSIVLILSRGTESEYTNNIMMSGVIAGTVCSSIIMFIVTVLDVETLHNLTWWMLGNLQPSNHSFLKVIIMIVLSGTLFLSLMGREANAISMGSEMAYYLGTSPKAVILIMLIIASALTASVVSLAGIIGFVGLIVPHSIRKIYGADHRRLFPLSFIWGGFFLATCDIISRTLLAPKEIPAGVITAFVGGPFFIFLLRRKNGSSQ